MRSKKIIFLLLCLILTGCNDKNYTITFDTLGGSAIESITIKEGENIKGIEVPKKDGYLFVTWLKDGLEYNSDSPVTEDINLTASWIETPEILDNYTVTFVNEGKEEKFIVKENDVVSEISPKEKANYIFIGWYLGDTEYNFNNKITKDITLEAKYRLDTVTVSYDLDGGEGLTSQIIPRNSLLSISETPIKEGYRFLKWILDNQEFSFNTKISKDITLTAVWEKIEYVTINYDTDGGNIINPTTIEKYSKVNNLPVPEKKDYIFKEWQLNNQTFNIETEIDQNITLKAIYEEK